MISNALRRISLLSRGETLAQDEEASSAAVSAAKPSSALALAISRRVLPVAGSSTAIEPAP